VLELMKHAKLARSIKLINGLVPGSLTLALAGDAVGSVIRT
jgi:molybdenum storage protein